MKQHARIRLVVIYVSAAVLMIGTVGPFLWLVSSSFQYERQLLSRPPQWLP
ncbi:MAG: carbohydrate ABC transporter permease, partial [Chloroflexi bacterium]|nr:carbohydrate ABC transporter permease [Chloroflexota bacterium]